MISRRLVLASGAASGAFGVAAQAAESSRQGALPHSGENTPPGGASGSNPGPKNPPLRQQNAVSFAPPATDHGDLPGFKYSFATAHNRRQDGGWARQVTEKDFPIAKSIAGVNMRLTAGGIRELHWHLPAEWSYMLYGVARITAVDQDGRKFVADVKEGDLWYFPSGIPHSIQGLGPDGCEFLLAFDDGQFSEFDTFLITDWMAHTPKDVLAKNFAVSVSTFDPIPKKELYIFQGRMPGPLQSDLSQTQAQTVPRAFNFSLSAQPAKEAKGGTIRIADSRNFPVASTIAAALVDVQPGGLRELHWHPNADEWQYWISGKGRMTVFAGGARARTMDFDAGDVGYVPRAFGHYVENTGDTTLRYLELFNSSHYADVSLADWMANTPRELVADHLHLDEKILASLPQQKVLVAPG
ncbi:MAG TPA: oxalate decarboxylase family bicupin [Acetobacteraceae bacterium]|nr:oxalate decarboxylase family bicupin [Acetobacteraceae bacterium]